MEPPAEKTASSAEETERPADWQPPLGMRISTFKKDEKVWVRFSGGRYYAGTITRVHAGGHYDIKYSDGDYEKQVNYTFLRPRK